VLLLGVSTLLGSLSQGLAAEILMVEAIKLVLHHLQHSQLNNIRNRVFGMF
jgi:hypothetical protein